MPGDERGWRDIASAPRDDRKFLAGYLRTVAQAMEDFPHLLSKEVFGEGICRALRDAAAFIEPPPTPNQRSQQ